MYKRLPLFIYSLYLTPTLIHLLLDPIPPSCSKTDPSPFFNSLNLQSTFALQFCKFSPIPCPNSQPGGHFLISYFLHTFLTQCICSDSCVFLFFLFFFFISPIPIFHPLDSDAKQFPPSPSFSASLSPIPAVFPSAAPRLDSLS